MFMGSSARTVSLDSPAFLVEIIPPSGGSWQEAKWPVIWSRLSRNHPVDSRPSVDKVCLAAPRVDRPARVRPNGLSRDPIAPGMSGFTIFNPNAVRSCACGASYYTAEGGGTPRSCYWPITLPARQARPRLPDGPVSCRLRALRVVDTAAQARRPSYTL